MFTYSDFLHNNIEVRGGTVLSDRERSFDSSSKTIEFALPSNFDTDGFVSENSFLVVKTRDIEDQSFVNVKKIIDNTCIYGELTITNGVPERLLMREEYNCSK